MPCDHSDPKTALGTGRVSAQRATIVDVAESLTCAFTTAELNDAVHTRDASIGQATVYRAVAAMEESGWLERVGERSGAALYARCSEGGHHHHHVICTTCGRTETTECPLDLAEAGATAAGFVVTGHEVTLYGLCPECAPPRRA